MVHSIRTRIIVIGIDEVTLTDIGNENDTLFSPYFFYATGLDHITINE